MANVVYWVTFILPGDRIVVANGLAGLTRHVPRQEVVGQTYVGTPPRPDEDGNRAAAFKLTDRGMDIFQHGTVGPPPGFRAWPQDVPEPTQFDPVPEDDE